MKYPRDLRECCRVVSECSKNVEVCVIPGGGIFADCVRSAHEVFKLSNDVAHWMAILGMNQYGFLLSFLIKNSRLVRGCDEAIRALQNGRIPIILPFDELYRNDPLPHSWSVTSDSIAAYFADKMGAKALVLLKDVDGVLDESSALKRVMRADELYAMKSTCVDRFLATLLKSYRLVCYVVNGRVPERVRSLLSGKETISTMILP